MSLPLNPSFGQIEIVNGTRYQCTSANPVKWDIIGGNSHGRRIESLEGFDSEADVQARALGVVSVGDRVQRKGFYSPSDGGSNWGIVKSGAHTAVLGYITSLDSNTYIEWNIKGTINAAKFGVIGDDTLAPTKSEETDYTQELATLFSVAGVGATIRFPSNVYIQSRSTQYMQEGQTLLVSGSELRFWHDGMVRDLVTRTGCTIKLEGGGVVDVTDDPVVYGAEYHQPICIGYSNSLTDAVDNVTVSGGYLNSTSPEGNLCFVFGACNNIRVSKITVPSGNALGEPFGGHWSVEPGGDETQGTGHPNNITFENITAESQSYGTSKGLLFFSAVLNATVRNIRCNGVANGAVVNIFAGDHGFEYATTLEAAAGSVITLQNITGRARKGVVVDMRDTLESGTRWPSRITLDNVHLDAQVSSDTGARGLDLGGVEGLTTTNTTVRGFYNGLFLNSRVHNLTLGAGTIIESSYHNGVDADNSADCGNIKLLGATIRNSNTANVANRYDLMFGSYIDGITIDNCEFDSPNVTYTGNFSSAEPPRNVKVTNSHVERSGGTNWVFGSSTSPRICEMFSGNTQGETNNNNVRGGQEVVAFSSTAAFGNKNPIKTYVTKTNNLEPATGTFHRGDTVQFAAPTAGGDEGFKVTVGGTQGTYSEGRTITASGSSTTVTLSGVSNVLRRGDYLTVNGVDVQIVSVSGTSLQTDSVIPAGSGLAISYRSATFKTYGSISA